MGLVFSVRCKKEGVEHLVNLPCLREAELICDRRENLDYREGSFSFESELGVDNRAFKVSGF